MDLLRNRYHEGGTAFGGVSIVPDVRFFTLYAYFNGPLGYRHENSDRMTDGRLELIADMETAMKRADPEALERWTGFYCGHEYHYWHYIYYVSYCGLPPGFMYDDREEKPIGSRDLEGFDRILAEFYSSCGLENLFMDKYRHILLENIRIYDGKRIEAETDFMYRYLRINREEHPQPVLVIVPLPFESRFVGFGAPHRNGLYLFESVGAQSGGINVHEYLHLFVNEAVESVEAVERFPIARCFERNRTKDWVVSDYGELRSWVAENFVWAITNRIGMRMYGRGMESFGFLAEHGLEPVPVLDEKLAAYEADPATYPDIYAFIRAVIRDERFGL